LRAEDADRLRRDLRAGREGWSRDGAAFGAARSAYGESWDGGDKRT
jgi:hypothetical protein